MNSTQPIISRNPATGETLASLTPTSSEELANAFNLAHQAQVLWAAQSPKRRAAVITQIREALVQNTDEIVDLITKENGKPKLEALANEVLPAAMACAYFSKEGPKALKDQKIKLTFMKHRKSTLQFAPLGVVAVIAPWNYPFLLGFVDIIMALLAGNAVIFKPSELTPLVGKKIQEICEAGGLPPHLLQTVIGDGTLGAAVIQNRPAKVFFTGSAATGRKVMAAAAEHLIPVNLELGGKNAMIILPDANLDFASSCALWGAFSNSGQICGATSRILVHERIADAFSTLLTQKMAQLRYGNPMSEEVDLGHFTMARQKATYDDQLGEAKSNYKILTGGEYQPNERALKPTLVAGENLERSRLYRNEAFGPIVSLIPFKSVSEVVQKANDSDYGLVASIITKNHALAVEIARQLQVGTVTINETIYTGGVPETPWGGVKQSGFGRTHSLMGLLEFSHQRHVHRPIGRLFIFKSLWWFPYTPYQYATFRLFIELFRKHWIDQIKALPHILWNLVKLIKEEKRL